MIAKPINKCQTPNADKKFIVLLNLVGSRKNGSVYKYILYVHACTIYM